MKIKIKPENKGRLHKELGVPIGKKLTQKDLNVKATDSPKVVKQKTFAKNAKKWPHPGKKK